MWRLSNPRWAGVCGPALLIVFTLLFVGTCAGETSRTRESHALFSMVDPPGDDFGAGGLSYPIDRAFYPFHGLMDLRRFSVFSDDLSFRFRFRFGSLANPWNAPEGFYHPRIDVYIHTSSGPGGSRPLRPGPGVRFAARWPWHLWLRVAPFGETAVYTWQDEADSPGRRSGIRVTSDAGRNTVEVLVPKKLLPGSPSEWRYYVLVGSFDGFGTDGYRRLAPDGPTRWLLGGESPARVVDMLAPVWGPRRQAGQLVAGSEEFPVIHPVGGFDLFTLPLWVYGTGGLAFLLGVAALIRPSFLSFCRSMWERRGNR